MKKEVKELIARYVAELDAKNQTVEATEHTFRAPLENLLQDVLRSILKKKDAAQVTLVNEPKRKEFGAPDFELRRGVMVLSFLETKPIGESDLHGTKASRNKRQFDRYKAAISTIAFTDYLEFVLYEDGQETLSARIGKLDDGHICMTTDERQQEAFVQLLHRLVYAKPQPVTSATELANIMARKAHLMASLIERHLAQHDGYLYREDWDDISELRGQFETFRRHLIDGLTEKDFADIYAQTITYGMFAARIHTKTPETFSRAEVPWFIPQTNPFLRSIFSSIAGADLDKDVAWIVDDLTKVLRVVNVNRVMRQQSKKQQHYDPLLHFYEDFLAAYDPDTRREKGVWYTPQCIVGYMVRAVDEVLQQHFGISDGLADRQTVRVDEKNYHRVQILDPATGTGTFLAEIVHLIYDRYRGQQGLWQSYVEDDLLPRLNGFEILMASYAIAHLKLDMVLQQTGYQDRNHQRLRIYLTNSLEEQRLTPISLFDYKLARESNQANSIKRRYPVMVMIGNPPYNNSSSNRGRWILKLIEEYKQNVVAKKLNLDDDYVKFIRLGQQYIHRNGEGVLAFVTNNNYLDATTFWQMRQSLLKAFDDIYILNLHGNIKSKEKTPSGEADENLFGIRQGVCIAIFVKTSGSQALGRIHYADLYGKKREKRTFLDARSLQTTTWIDMQPTAPHYFFVPKDFSLQAEYEKGFRVDELFRHYNSGVQTKRDELNVFFTDEERQAVLRDFKEGDLVKIVEKYHTHDNRDWKVQRAMKDLQEHPVTRTRINYRPFDNRYTNYTGYSRGIMGYPRDSITKHLDQDNLLLLTCKQQSTFPFQHVFVTRLISDLNSVSAQSKEQTYVFPLYLYDEKGNRETNLNQKVVNQLTTADDTPQDVFDYVYAVLHSPRYRQRYSELLRIGFPRIPYPADHDEFLRLAGWGRALRELHLMENLPGQLNALGVAYLGEGDNMVKQVGWRDDVVWINDENRFEGISADVWNFYVGGYQPLQKWLQYRKGRRLTMDDIVHVERMAYAIRQTLSIMEKIQHT